jgi:hypothetical protein
MRYKSTQNKIKWLCVQLKKDDRFHNFQDAKLNDGVIVAKVVESIKPGIVNWDNINLNAKEYDVCSLFILSTTVLQQSFNFIYFMAALWAVFTFGVSDPPITAHGSLDLKQEIQIQIQIYGSIVLQVV